VHLFTVAALTRRVLRVRRLRATAGADGDLVLLVVFLLDVVIVIVVLVLLVAEAEIVVESTREHLLQDADVLLVGALHLLEGFASLVVLVGVADVFVVGLEGLRLVLENREHVVGEIVERRIGTHGPSPSRT
jgi:hypothetical protein